MSSNGVDIMKDDLREIVIEVNDLGLQYKSKQKVDDYKSYAINLLRGKAFKRKTKDTSFWPLKNINFKAYKGEVLGIVGSNGSGKTTMCKLLTGIIEPDEGELYVDGRVSALFSFGMGTNRRLSGRENVYLNGMMIGLDKDTIDQSIDAIKEFSGLGDFFEQPMKKYSSGMRARLGFSVASHLDPEILILDEALNTGDRAFSKKAAKKIQELVEKAKLVIIVTHSHKFAKKYCDRVIWLEQGRVKEIGDPKTVIANYEATVPKGNRKIRKRLDLKNIETTIGEQVVIDAKNIGVHYRLRGSHHWAIRHLNIQIKEGEVVGIIGRNGAGKSTICKVFTKIISPDEGHITVNGETTALLNYGTGFNRQLSGRDNVYLNGMLLGIPKDVVMANMEKISQFSGLEKVMDKSIKQYSSGMRARLGFSIAATLRPDIFIIDEALSTGDMAFKQKATEKIQEMMEQSKAVIIVSHSMSFVEKVCTRAIWIEHGEVMMDGPSEDVVAAYREKGKIDQNRTKRT